jgi:hypothetical protein
MSRPLWFVQFIKRAFPRRFLAARATKVPIIGRILDHWLFEGDDLIYLPKDQVIEINQSLDMPGEVVLPSTSWIPSGSASVQGANFLPSATAVPAAVFGGCCPRLRPGLAPRSHGCLALLSQ